MRIPINHSALVDSPYNGDSSLPFQFTSTDTDDLVQDIVNGKPTCYLISGYRGAGKSSFIRKVEIEVKQRDEKSLFVFLNFAKYEERSIVLRKLIRSFYLAIESSNIILQDDQSNGDILLRLRDLYERTFFEVSKNTNERAENRWVSIFRFRSTLSDLIVTLVSLFTSVACLVGFNFKWPAWILASFPMLGVWRFFYSEIEESTEKTATSVVSKSTLYDDEIAEYHLTKVLTDFSGLVKPVFVLDELDKIEDDSLVERLINELKPIMLSGLASFIVVGGQNLYYNYYSSETRDDGPLLSLFSRVHHVPLLSPAELRIIFFRLIEIRWNEFSDSEKTKLKAYVDCLIFTSRRIPRRFILLLRQNAVWEGNQSYLFIPDEMDELSVYSQVLSRIEWIENNEIAAGNYSRPVQDYFCMQLMTRAHEVMNYHGRSFTLEEIVGHVQKTS